MKQDSAEVANSQFKFVLMGETQFPDSTVFELINDNGEVLQQTMTTAGRYVLKGTVPRPDIYSIKVKTVKAPFQSFELFIEPEESYKVKDKKDIQTGRHTFEIKSTSDNENKLQEYNAGIQKIQDKLAQKRAFYQQALDTTNNKDLFNSYYHQYSLIDDTNRMDLAAYKKSFMLKNPDNLIVPALISRVNDLADSVDKYDQIMDSLNPLIKNSALGKDVLRSIDKFKVLGPGKNVPKLFGRTIEGNEFNYDFSTKKLVLLDFWESSSYESSKLRVKYRGFFKKYHKKGFDIISISVDDYKTWIEAYERSPTPWTNINENKPQKESKNIASFFITALPSNVLIDQDGNILEINISTNILIDYLEEL